jgi:hypothetical protein
MFQESEYLLLIQIITGYEAQHQLAKKVNQDFKIKNVYIKIVFIEYHLGLGQLFFV